MLRAVDLKLRVWLNQHDAGRDRNGWDIATRKVPMPSTNTRSCQRGHRWAWTGSRNPRATRGGADVAWTASIRQTCASPMANFARVALPMNA